MFKNIFAVSKKHEIWAIFTFHVQRIRRILSTIAISFFFPSFVPLRKNIWSPAQIPGTRNAWVAGKFCPTLYIFDRWPMRTQTSVHCIISVKVNAKKVTTWSRKSQRRRNNTILVHTELRMIISYLTILTTSNYDKIWGSYDENGDNFTVVQAWNFWELSAMIAFTEPAKVCVHVQIADVCGYSLVCSAPAGAHDGPCLRSRSPAPHGARIGSSMPRTHDDNFDHTVDLTT